MLAWEEGSLPSLCGNWAFSILSARIVLRRVLFGCWLGLVLFGVGVFKIGYHFIFRLPLTPCGAQVGLKVIANLLPQLLCAENTNMSLHTHHLE